ncbi:YlxR family protein [Actinopolymorpha sp. B17G11]|uniref:YlxR family protein n=1 Tax=unclassified Actinopolymorpha TaxID=2627063 RepID=UPI0032D9517C
MRTCVGCRLRTAKSELLRVVLERDTETAWLVPDVSGHAPGRGAHVHPTPECVGLAARRHAFPRALRIQGPIDIEKLRRHVEAQTENSNTREQRQGLNRGPARRKESGSSGS